MLIGIMSDSHGDTEATQRAVSGMLTKGCQSMFHCGDVCGSGVLDVLAAAPSVHFVWGNCDHDAARWRPYLREVGLPWPEPPVQVAMSGKTLLLAHGHEPGFDRFPRRTGVDYLLSGHTHVREDRREGAVRCINPGALYRASIKSFATLDLENDLLTFYRLDGTPLS